MHYVGLDIHKEFTYGVIENKKGEVIREEKFSNSDKNFSKFLDICNPENTKIVMESTGMWESIYDPLEKKGYDVVLASPVKTKAIASAKIKTDAIDAKTLTDLLRANMIVESYVPNKEMRVIREKVRNRKALVKIHTQTINKIKSAFIRQGIKLPWKRWGKYTAEWIDGQEVKNKELVMRYINVLTKIEEEARPLQEELDNIAYSREDTKLLMTIPGIGPVHSMTLVSEIADVTRFSNSGQLACYAGLIPGLRQSGKKSITTGLVQQANKSIKAALVQACWSAVKRREANTLQLHYKRLAKKKGKQKAICATARKMATIVHAMLRKKEEFIA